MNGSILQRIAAGDHRAVDDCLTRYGGLIWSLAKRWIGNVADAEDATQEIFVELWQQAGRFNPAVAGEATFVAMVARRRLIDRMRKEARRPITESIDVDLVEVNDAQEFNVVDGAEDAAKAKRCLSRLSAQQQEILTLAVHHGASHTVIASRLSIPLGSVKSGARRGLIQLRDCMKRNSESAVIPIGSASVQALNRNGSR